jgi:GT2 family glycosyltransferase
MNNKRKIQNGIIIVNYNTKKDTVTLVDSLLDYNYPIVIVDNDSFDDSLCLFKSILQIQIMFILSIPNKYGYAKGNNIGIKFLKSNYSSKYITILNPDVQISQIFLKK